MARKSRKTQSITEASTVEKNPKIVAFICNWQSKNKHKPVDLLSKKYATDIHFLRVMCASRIDRGMLLKCVQEKVDGIFIGICNAEQCRYKGGIDLARIRFQNTIELLDILGYDKSRIFIFEDDDSPVNLLPEKLEDFSKNIKKLGFYK
ncbi:MAG: hydrogenase iron-sulfur subunit [Candidatus Lokiarchaeota archaeon]|nr:hydrogenase iron-sulfur subunit [Candidatus Lokiarchaeota archaeon]